MKNSRLYLRDKGVLLYKDENNFLKTIYKCNSLRKNVLNIQITLNLEFFITNYKKIERELVAELLKFDRVLFHLHSDNSNKLGRNYFTDQSLCIIQNLYTQCSNIDGICIHPDQVDDFSVLDRFILNNKYIGIEVLDKSKNFGNRFSEIKKILEEHDFLGLVLDIAHIQEMEEEGEPDLKHYIDCFSNRVQEIHVSQSGNYYSMDKMSENFNTSHSLLSTANNDIIKTLSKSKIPENTNYVIEGVIPYGEYGERLLEKEVMLLKTNLF